MTGDLDKTMESIAGELRDTARDLRVDAFLSISYAADIINMRVNIGLKKYGIGQTTLGIMYLLVTHGGSMTPTDLSKKIFRTKQAITLAVDSLEKGGLVTREPIGGDRRTRRIKITRKGLDLVKETMADRRELIFSVMSCLGQEEMEQLSTTLKKVRRNLRKQMENPTSQR